MSGNMSGNMSDHGNTSDYRHMTDYRNADSDYRGLDDSLANDSDRDADAPATNTVWGWVVGAVFVLVIIAVIFGSEHRQGSSGTNTASNSVTAPATSRMAPPAPVPTPSTAPGPIPPRPPLARRRTKGRHRPIRTSETPSFMLNPSGWRETSLTHRKTDERIAERRDAAATGRGAARSLYPIYS